MCCGPRVYSIQKRPTYKYKRHTRPRAVRTVRLRVTEWQSGQWQRNAECSRQLAQNFPKERHYRSTTHSAGGGGGRPLLPPTPETYVGGRRAAAHRRGAPLRGRGVKGGHDGLRPLARGALRALAVTPSGGRWRCSGPTFARDARTDVRGAETRERKRRYRRIPSACGERATKRAAPARARAGSAMNRTVGTARRARCRVLRLRRTGDSATACQTRLPGRLAPRGSNRQNAGKVTPRQRSKYER